MKTRAIGYGRKSFDDPRNRTASVDDQHLFARRYAEGKGWLFVDFFGDNGVTGATMERPGLQAAIATLVAGKAEILIVEDVDRLGRDQEHLSYMRKLFAAHGVTVHTVAAGVLDDLVFSFKGIIGEQQRARIAYTTRRGLKAKASRGGSTGGRILGYQKTIVGNDAQGRSIDKLEVCPDEAELVRRIFELYAAGTSLKGICHVLNSEGIASPRARETGKYNAGVWNPSTLSGNVDRGEGILNNETYIGRRIFNRRTWIEIPTETRGFSRRPRLNPESEWVIHEDPSLRILDQKLWDAVKERQIRARAARDAHFKLTGNPLGGAKRPSHLLTGLVICGRCGDKFVSLGGRWRCKSAIRKDCSNGSILGKHLEERALAGIRGKLLTPELIAQFASHFQRELEEQLAQQDQKQSETASELASVLSRTQKILRRVEEDDEAPKSLIRRLAELETEEARLRKELEALPRRPIVRLPANYEAIYRAAIADLEQRLAKKEAASSRDLIRALVEKIVVKEGDSRGGKLRKLELHGDLYRMLEFSHKRHSNTKGEAGKANASGSSIEGVTPVVAGVGFEPTTFRL